MNVFRSNGIAFIIIYSFKNLMENTQQNSPEKGSGIGPVLIISAILIAALAALKLFMD